MIPLKWTDTNRSLICDGIIWKGFKISSTKSVLVSCTNPYVIVSCNDHSKTKTFSAVVTKKPRVYVGKRFRDETRALIASAKYLRDIDADLNARLENI